MQSEYTQMFSSLFCVSLARAGQNSQTNKKTKKKEQKKKRYKFR